MLPVLIEPIENLLNRNLSRSPAARALCASLAGQALGVQITGLPERLVLDSLGTSLKLSRDDSRPAVVDVSGSPINLLIMLSSDPQAATTKRLLASGAVTIKGDTDVLQRYRQMLSLIQPDVPAEIETLLGDSTTARTVAHHFSQTLRSAIGFGRHAARTATLNAAEYLAHETRDLVPRAEAEQFLLEVDLLREHTDRLAARIDQLAKDLTPTGGPTP